MKIALITNELPHHKFWTYQIHKYFDVGLIIHKNKRTLIETLKRKRLLRYGITWLPFKLASILYNFVSRKSMSRSLLRHEFKFFSRYISKYKAISDSKKFKFNSVNDKECINLIKKNNIDVICFLGGDIAKSEIINSSRITTLNFHSGISPYYNGTKTTFHSVSDFRPNFCGGTIMHITEKIDGGNVLAHYLTPIKVSDTAASLFMKGIIGSVKLYFLVLKMIENGQVPLGIKQQKSIKFVRYNDWTIVNDLRLRHFEKGVNMKSFERSSKIIKYFDDNETDYTFSKTLSLILGKS